MFLIKSCPKCKRKIRFPIDKGEIKVKCVCGYSFNVDPDDPETFKNGKFDLSNGRNRIFSLKGIVEKLNNQFKKKLNLKFMINKIYDAKYKLQNFKLLPGSEQKKIVFEILIFFTLFFVLFYMISKLLINKP